MTATAAPPAPGTNYRAKRTFGNYKEGTVFPRWRLAFAGDVDEMVKRGMVEPTTDPVVEKFDVPARAEKPSESVPDEATQKELNTANEELEALRGANAALLAQVADLEKSQHARLVEWGRATDQHAFERSKDAAKVRGAQEAEAAVRSELRTAQDRIADLEKKLSAGAPKKEKEPKEKKPEVPVPPAAPPAASPAPGPVPPAPAG